MLGCPGTLGQAHSTSTVDRASDATSQYRGEIKVLHMSGQEWLRLLDHER